MEKVWESQELGLECKDYQQLYYFDLIMDFFADIEK